MKMNDFILVTMNHTVQPWVTHIVVYKAFASQAASQTN